MTLVRNYTVRQANTVTLVSPVLDGDDENTDFYSNITNVTINWTLTDSSGTEQIAKADVNISTPEFQNVKLNNSDFPEAPTIPDTQEVVTVKIPETQTGSLVAGEEHSYELRAEDTNPTPDERFTFAIGTVTVEEKEF